MADPLAMLAHAAFGYAQARHLLSRAGFGADDLTIRRIQKLGVNRAVSYLVDFERVSDAAMAKLSLDPNIMRPPNDHERRLLRENADHGGMMRGTLMGIRNSRLSADYRQLLRMQQWWLGRLLTSPRPLEENLTLFWHGHFVSNYRNCRDSYLLQKQHELFRRHACGSFSQLTHLIIKDPAMITFLDNDRNIASAPNENLARELMELFTLGEGHYTERDIKEGARALTGHQRTDNGFVLVRKDHDDGVKEILGQRGRFDGDGFVDVLLAQPQCARWVCGKLYRWFVDDLPEGPDEEAGRFIEAMADLLRKSGYLVRPVMKAMLSSAHFFEERRVGAIIRSPIHLAAGTVRALNLPMRDAGLLADDLDAMGQSPYNPPNVAGWPGGRSWISTSTLFQRQNLTRYLITGRRGDEQGEAGFDPTRLLEPLDSREPEAVVDYLLRLLLAVATTEANRAALIDFVAGRGGSIDGATLLDLLCLIAALPEYQLA